MFRFKAEVRLAIRAASLEPEAEILFRAAGEKTLAEGSQ